MSYKMTNSEDCFDIDTNSDKNLQTQDVMISLSNN